MYRKRLQTLENRQQQIESQIAELEKLSNKCTQDIKAESNAARRSQLNTQIDNYSTEIDELYDKLEQIEEQIEEQINKIQSSSPGPGSNNYLKNHRNKQQLKIKELLCYINFKKALNIFDKIQSQFDKNGDTALFFMEKSLSKRGDLCLQRLRSDCKSNINPCYRNSFRYCPVSYASSADLEAVVQGIANYLNIKNEQDIEILVSKIGESLQNDSIMFIEINCDIHKKTEIVPLIPWFIKKFWLPLRSKINQIRNDYEGIKVIAIIVSRLEINQIMLINKLLPYYNQTEVFYGDKLVKMPLDDWTEDEIFDWLKLVDPGLTIPQRNEIANKIYQDTKGKPNDVCYFIEKDLQTLISSRYSSA